MYALCIWKDAYCFSELLVPRPAAALEATADAESKTRMKKQHFLLQISLFVLTILPPCWEKCDSHYSSLFYIANLQHGSDGLQYHGLKQASGAM